MGLFTIAIGYDGCLLGPTDHAGVSTETVASVKSIHAAGNRLVLFSRSATMWRETPALDGEIQRFWLTGEVPALVTEQWDKFRAMRADLMRAGIWDLFEVWQSPGKPEADVYLGDGFEEPRWREIAGQFGATRREVT